MPTLYALLGTPAPTQVPIDVLFQIKDEKGDTLEYPKVITSTPFWDSANTYFFNDDYTVSCGGQYTDQSGGKARKRHPSKSFESKFLLNSNRVCNACMPKTLPFPTMTTLSAVGSI
jgi:hypothetical protein